MTRQYDLAARARRIAEELLTQGDFAVAGEIFAPDPMRRGTGSGVPGMETAKAWIGSLRQAFPDLCAIVEDVVASDDAVVLRLSMSGTHRGTYLGAPASDRHANWTLAVILRADPDGTFETHWAIWDQFDLLRQLGAVPWLPPGHIAGAALRVASRDPGFDPADIEGDQTVSTTDFVTAARRRGTVAIALVLTMLLGAIGITNSAAQETAGHPLIGTWVVDPEVDDPANPPSFDAFMADGTVVNIGSDGASVGSWEATGPGMANFMFSGLVAGAGGGAYFVIRGTIVVDQAGETFTGAHSFTMVAADGTILAAAEGGGATGTRLQTEPQDMVGQAPAGFPTWTPAFPAAATPEG